MHGAAPPPHRSHSPAGADQGSLTLQPPPEDPTAAGGDQGRQAPAEGDEEGQGVPCDLRLRPRNGGLDPETGTERFPLPGLPIEAVAVYLYSTLQTQGRS